MDRTTFAVETLLPNEPIAIDVSRLYARFHTLVDQRARRGVRYPLPLVLTIALLAKLSGHHQVRAMADWARLRATELVRLFSLAHPAMPHHTTWSRILC